MRSAVITPFSSPKLSKRVDLGGETTPFPLLAERMGGDFYGKTVNKSLRSVALAASPSKGVTPKIS